MYACVHLCCLFVNLYVCLCDCLFVDVFFCVCACVFVYVCAVVYLL